MSANELTIPAIATGVDQEIAEETVRFQHFPALDGLRAVAVILVVVHHLILLVPGFAYFADGGFLGVDVFFVLSGFLITSILLKEHGRFGKISLRNFFIRRSLRLVPALWAFLLLLYFFGRYLLPHDEAVIIYSENNFAYAFFYLMNLYKAATDAMTGHLNHTWSLAIEEQFYIVWSLVLYKAFNENRSRRAIAVGTAAFIVALVASRAIRAAYGADPTVLYYSTDTRIDAILIGCLASMIYCWRLFPDELFRSRAFGLSALTAVFAALYVLSSFKYSDRSLYMGFISVFTFSVATIMLWLITREKSAVHTLLASKPMRWFGAISYSLYLWHYLAFEFAKMTFSSIHIQLPAGIMLAFAAASFSHYLIEKPFLRSKERFERA